MENRLTVKQEKFCINYFKCGNATEAAISAGYSPRTAAVIANENLKKPYIASRLKELQGKAASSTIADVIERKEVMTSILRDSKSVNPSDRIRATSELNKMEHIYEGGDTVNNLFIIKEVEVRLSGS